MLKRLARKFLRRLAWELDYARDDTRDLGFAARGEGVRFASGCRFVSPEGIRLGSYIYIGPYSFLAGTGGLEIRDNVAIGPHVYIYTTNHHYERA